MAEAKRNKYDQAVADLVTKMRKEKKLSQNQIASYIGTHRSFVAQVEMNDSDVKYNVSHLNQIAYYLGCSVWDLMPKEPIQEDIRKPAKKYPRQKRIYKKKNS